MKLSREELIRIVSMMNVLFKVNVNEVYIEDIVVMLMSPHFQTTDALYGFMQGY